MSTNLEFYISAVQKYKNLVHSERKHPAIYSAVWVAEQLNNTQKKGVLSGIFSRVPSLQISEKSREFLEKNISSVAFFISCSRLEGEPKSGIYFGTNWFIGSDSTTGKSFPLSATSRIVLGSGSRGNKGTIESLSSHGDPIEWGRSVLSDGKIGMNIITDIENDIFSALYVVSIDDVDTERETPSSLNIRCHHSLGIMSEDYKNKIFRFEQLTRPVKDTKQIIKVDDIKLSFLACDEAKKRYGNLEDFLTFLNTEYINRIKSFLENERLQKLRSEKSRFLELFDPDADGLVDIDDAAPYQLLLKDSQKAIIAIDRDYIQKFIKISSYLSSKSSNINLLYDKLKKMNSIAKQSEIAKGLSLQVMTYQGVLFHSYVMLEALLSDDMVTFYQVYESFDKLSIFDSSFEKGVSDKLHAIDDRLGSIEGKLLDLINLTARMENNICNQLQGLRLDTVEGLASINTGLSARLDKIGKKIDLGNLMHSEYYKSIAVMR